MTPEETHELLIELRTEVRHLRDELAETKAMASSTKSELAAIRNRGYGFLGALTLIAGAVGAKLQSVLFGGP